MSNAGGSATSFPIRYADILFVENVLDPNGQNPKTRRVVILTPDDTIATGSPIVAGAITGTLPDPLTNDYVMLPYKNPPGTRHPRTGLTKKAAVLCSWLVIIERRDVVGRSGFVPSSSMAIIDHKTSANAKTMGGWS
jgi:mRNA-degrading endonuclease toxin of MazEF toxin-antitoxin module